MATCVHEDNIQEWPYVRRCKATAAPGDQRCREHSVRSAPHWRAEVIVALRHELQKVHAKPPVQVTPESMAEAIFDLAARLRVHFVTEALLAAYTTALIDAQGLAREALETDHGPGPEPAAQAMSEALAKIIDRADKGLAGQDALGLPPH